jgi:hypothetical protein
MAQTNNLMFEKNVIGLWEGSCLSKDETYAELEGDTIISFQGLRVGYTPTAASVDERDAL